MLTRSEMQDALIKLDRRLAAVEQILQPMAKDVAGLRTDVAVLKTDVAVLKTDLTLLDGDVSGVQRDVAALSRDLQDTKQEVLAAIGQLTHRLEARGVI